MFTGITLLYPQRLEVPAKHSQIYQAQFRHRQRQVLEDPLWRLVVFSLEYHSILYFALSPRLLMVSN